MGGKIKPDLATALNHSKDKIRTNKKQINGMTKTQTFRVIPVLYIVLNGMKVFCFCQKAQVEKHEAQHEKHTHTIVYSAPNSCRAQQ